MAQTVTDFVLNEKDRLQKFEIWWMAMNQKNPEIYPLSMVDGNEGLWWEQFQEFDASWLDALRAK